MSTVSAVSQVSTARAPTDGPAPGGLTSGADFSVFLRMLTTQMQNQNPLNPVEAADFAVQLATFAGVEQQVQTNTLLARLNENTLSQEVAAWLGTEVAVEGVLRVVGTPVELHLPPADAGATRRDVVIATPTGAEVARFPIAPGQTHIGLDPASVPNLVPGSYRATVEDADADRVLQTGPALHFTPVQEVRKAAGGVQLVLATGDMVLANDIAAARRP